MPELRQNIVTRDWVIIATERGKRPSDFGPEPERKRTGFCPFCPERGMSRRSGCPGTSANRPW